jgi:hypothetical protein
MKTENFPADLIASITDFVTNAGPGYDNGFVMDTSYVPATSTSPGTKGQITADSNYLYFCKDTNLWVRTALSEWE